ncbi:hypothetical protein [Rubritalea tangerina]|uniref:SURF1-like protein n=1 Tax=Rubritalea tangerina TaxID=430798 RepID=A0ABW4ZBN4_9BACT
MSKPNTEATGKPTPIAGCTIFLVILGMVSFLAIFAWYQYGQYKTEIINISQKEAKPTPLASLDDKAAISALDAKMGAFERAVKNGDKTQITFTPEEMNLAIARYDKLKPFRGMMSIREITEQTIIADICFEVRAGFEGERFLNGSMTIEPEIAMGSLFPTVTEISPDTGNPVPPKMTREFPTFLFTEYRNDEELAKVFHKLSTVQLSPGLMTIVSDPKIKQPDALPENVDDDVDKALYLFGLLVFMFSTTVAFLLWVRKRKQQAENE